jgi:predicted nucleotidyltransferase
MLQFYRISEGVLRMAGGNGGWRIHMGAGMNRNVQTEEAVKRLVAFFAPEKVYLFGSTARGEDRPDSDLDFLIVLPDDAPHEKLRA